MNNKLNSWININDQIIQGLEIINKIENGKLRLLVNRICQSLESGKNENIFSIDEKEKLSTSLNLNGDDLTLLLITLTSIYSQAAFHMIKPKFIETSMKEIFSIGHDKVAILSHAWITHSEGVIEAFKKKSIFPNQVTDISWSVDVKATSSTNAKEAKPVAKLQLKLEGSQESRVTVEMDKEQLWGLFNQLNEINAQLDSLKKEK